MKYDPRPRTASGWRLRARRVIDDAVRGEADSSPEELLAAVDAAYPFGPRAYHPYRAWLAERRWITWALGLAELPRDGRLRRPDLARSAFRAWLGLEEE